ncbi:MAG: YcaO-like family protein [Candidatus Limnocylindria bacterium]
MRGFSLLTAEPIWVPAQLAYFKRCQDDAPLGELTTTGLAAGVSIEDAIRRGLCEVIERDAVMLTWLLRVRAPALSLSEPALAPASALAALLGGAGRELRVFDVTTDLRLPAFLAIIRTDGTPAIAAGAACSPPPAQAVEKAILEAAHARFQGRRVVRRGRRRLAGSDFREVTSFSSRSELYAQPEMGRAVDHLWAVEPSVMLRPPGSIRHALTRLQEIGVEPVGVDVTCAEVARLGLRVARVIAPGLQPMEARFDARRYAAKRFPALVGVPGWWAELNSLPHPIP